MALESDSEEERPSEEEMALESDAEEEMALESDWNVGLAAKLGNGGVILVLFETPSGFALFSYDGVKLLLPGAIKNIWGEFVMEFMAKYRAVWLKDFQTFEDKASALKLDTGVNEQLAKMLQKWIQPGQKLAVGKPEYKTIIECNLGISCLWNDEVMELMWGLKNQMQYLVPDEKSELTKEDRLPMCEGMKIALNRHGFHVKPEMVNKSIIETTGLVYECDFNVDKHAEYLSYAGEHLKEISGINSEDWDLLKLATALMMLCYPNGEQPVAGDLRKLFGDDYSKLVEDAPKYKDKFYKVACLNVYGEMLRARRIRSKAFRRLAALIKRAKRAYEAEQAMSSQE